MSAVSPDSVSEPARPAVRGRHEGGPQEIDGHVHSPERHVPGPAPAQDTQTMTEAGELLRALAAPVRISIVLQLRVAQRCVHELVDALGVAQPLISQHLRVLKSAGVVYGERHGREVVYRLVDEHLAHIVVDAVAHADEARMARPRRRAAVRGSAAEDTRTETA